MPIDDPDQHALLLVQQWLAESGYVHALAALEQEAGLRYTAEKLERGGVLLELVYERMERDMATALDDDARERRRREERLLVPGRRDTLPTALLHATPLPQSNVLCVACLPSLRLALAGCADGMLRTLSYDGAVLGETRLGTSGVLCLSLVELPTPGSSGGRCLLAAGCMDGSVVVAGGGDWSGGEGPCVLHRQAAHKKYVVAVAWTANGGHLVSGSWDQTFAVHHWQQQQDSSGSSVDAVASGGSTGGSLQLIHKEHCTGQVTALQVLPGDASNGGSTSNSGRGHVGASFLVAVRGSNYLRQHRINPSIEGASQAPARDAAAGAVAGGAPAAEQVVLEARLNMNASGDDHLSFSAVALSLSPDSQYLLVSADNGRLVMYDLAGFHQVRNVFGLLTEQFHQFGATFDASGRFVLAAEAHGGVAVFDVASAKRVTSWRAHEKNVRGLAYDAAHGLLLTCSFDRTVKVWGAPTA